MHRCKLSWLRSLRSNFNPRVRMFNDRISLRPAKQSSILLKIRWKSIRLHTTPRYTTLNTWQNQIRRLSLARPRAKITTDRFDWTLNLIASRATRGILSRESKNSHQPEPPQSKFHTPRATNVVIVSSSEPEDTKKKEKIK